MTRVKPRYILPLFLGHFILAEIEVVRDLHLPLKRLAGAAAQPGLAFRDEDEFHAEAVGELRRQLLGLLRVVCAVHLSDGTLLGRQEEKYTNTQQQEHQWHSQQQP